MSLDLASKLITLEYNGPDGINIIFMGDGFTASQQEAYTTKVETAVNAFFSFEPFDTRRSEFNIYSIPTVSNEAGISYITHPNNPIAPVVKDTFLGAYFNKGGMIRLTSFTKKEEVELELTRMFTNRVFVILICNSPTYGGSGMFPDDKFMTVTQITMETQYNTFKEIMMHEFGHSFGGLGDEYGGNCGSDKPESFTVQGYDRPNVTLDPINDRKWDGIVQDPQYILGANYCNSMWYRSTDVGLMRGWFVGGTLLDEKHNELGIYLLNKRINEEVLSNKKTITYIDDDDVETDTRMIAKFRRRTNDAKKDVRINSDVVIRAKLSIFKTIYINKGCTLTVESGSYIYYDRMVNNGTFIMNGTMYL